MPPTRLRIAVLAVLLACLLVAPQGTQAAAPAATNPGTRSVVFVGNNWAGTATIVDAHRLRVLKRGVNLVPDKEQELADIYADPEKLAFY